MEDFKVEIEYAERHPEDVEKDGPVFAVETRLIRADSPERAQLIASGTYAGLGVVHKVFRKTFCARGVTGPDPDWVEAEICR